MPQYPVHRNLGVLELFSCCPISLATARKACDSFSFSLLSGLRQEKEMYYTSSNFLYTVYLACRDRYATGCTRTLLPV